MPETLQVELTPSRIEIEPGAAPVEAVVTLRDLRNQGDPPEQYTVEVTDLDPEWFAIPVASVGLFPQDSEKVRITFHPPRRPGLHAKPYPFRVRVRSRSGEQEATVEGVLDVRGFAVFHLDLVPRRLTARGKGTFRVQVANTGTVDIQIGLEARDAEGACRVRFPKGDAPSVRAGGKTEVPLVVEPTQRPWVGPDRTYEFGITAQPLGARGEPQALTGEITHHPWLPSWQPLRRHSTKLLATLVVLVTGGLFVASPAPSRGWGGLQAATVRAQDAIACVPAVGALVRRGRQCPPPPPRCLFDLGFREFTELHGGLVGTCMSKAAYNLFGDARQYTTNGVLFWQRASNTVYFFKGTCVYAYVGGRTEWVDGPEQCKKAIDSG